MTRSEQHLQIILAHPLNNTLDPLRKRLRNTNETDGLQQEDVASFLSALVGSTAAFRLPSPDKSGNVAVKLFAI